MLSFYNIIKNKLKIKIKNRYPSKENINKILKDLKNIIKPFFCITIIIIIALSAMIRADFNYNDDLRSVAEGYVTWNHFSRFGTTFLSKIVHNSKYLYDISPLPQLLAVCIMALTGIIILYVYKDEKKFTFWDVISVIPLALSPYYLECFSYKYDAPYTALSVLASVFPLLFKKNKYAYIIVLSLCILLMCITYQASSGIFLMCVLLVCLKDWNKGKKTKETFKFLIISVTYYLCVLLIFKTYIMIPVDTYVTNQMFSIKELIPGVINNLYKYFSYILLDFRKEWLVLIALIFISCIYVFIKDSKQKKYIALPVNVVSIIVMVLLSFGVYPVLMKPLFDPRAMYGFGICIALAAIAIANSKKAYLSKIFIICIDWAFIVFALTYGNALKIQNEYTDFRVNLVINDLNDLEIFKNDEEKTVEIMGTIGQAPTIENMPQNYQILNRLIPIQFKEEWMWGLYYFYNYFDLRNVKQDETIELKDFDLPILKDTMYHTIKGNDKYVLIELK